MSDSVFAWHFTNGNKLRDGSPLPAIGVPLVYEGPSRICETGLHASLLPFDALKYAPGSMLHYVQCKGIEEQQNDKFVCRQRTIVSSTDAGEMLRYFARMQALSVAHLYAVPEVTLEFLMTGNKSIQAAAGAAARAASWYADWDSAGAAARAAAWAAAWAAAGAASWYAAWDAARAAAGSAAWAAARDAAREEFNALVYENFGLDNP